EILEALRRDVRPDVLIAYFFHFSTKKVGQPRGSCFLYTPGPLPDERTFFCLDGSSQSSARSFCPCISLLFLAVDNNNNNDRGQKVTVHCTGYGKNRDLSEKFWSTTDPGQVPFSYNIGLGSVIKGWDQGVMDMGVGERAKLTCTPDYAYGEGG
ncbi:unnamed protein product, partial [Ectocarpus sp. 4 AP-2014]